MSSEEVVKTIQDTTGRREVRIVRNSHGSFGFEEWRLSAYHSAIRGRGEFWEPISKRRSFADSPETAEREARAGVDWLIPESKAEDSLPCRRCRGTGTDPEYHLPYTTGGHDERPCKDCQGTGIRGDAFDPPDSN